MPSANRCPKCRETIHPFAASCENCGADLDAHRRARRERTQRSFLTLPHFDRDSTDGLIVAVILILLALFAPLFGVCFGLLVVVHANRSGWVLRRNIAIACTVLSVFDLIAPTVLLPHLII